MIKNFDDVVFDKKFFHLKVIAKDIKSNKYKCLCDCGKYVDVSGSDLNNKKRGTCGCGIRNINNKYNAVNVIDKVFGYVKIISFLNKDKSTKPMCNCKCICGNEFIYDIYSIIKGSKKSCGCIKRKKSKQSYKDFDGQFWSKIRYKAREREILFNLDIKEGYLILEKQNFICPFTGIKLSRREKNLSLDRIDSNQDYSINNCQWVFKKINAMKRCLTNDEFIKICYLVTNPIKNNAPNLVPSYKDINWCYIKAVDKNKTKRLYLYDKLLNQQGYCAITGLPLKFSDKKNFIPFQKTASVDRIDSSKGYFFENCWWVHKDVNFAKLDMNMLDFIKICGLVFEYNRNKYEIYSN